MSLEIILGLNKIAYRFKFLVLNCVPNCLTQNLKLKTQNSLILSSGLLVMLVAPATLAATTFEAFDLRTVAPRSPDLVVPAVPDRLAQATAAQILTPQAGEAVNARATQVIIQFAVGTEIDLRVNGRVMDLKLIGRTETNAETQQVIQTWYGVPLDEGENRLELVDRSSGAVLSEVQIQVQGAVTKLELRPVESRIPADGRSVATIQGLLLDEKGDRTSRDGVVTLVATEGEFVGPDFDDAQPGFQVQVLQGQFSTQLRSSLNAGQVTIRAVTNDRLEAFTQLQFDTYLRPSLATGVVEFRLGGRGTDFYRGFRQFLPVDGNNDTVFDVYSAAFATGRVGNWLFTGAYNSRRTLNEDCDGNPRLFRDQQFCDRAYPVYGDDSKIETVAPSRDSLFLRLERTSPIANAGTDFFMWGDYYTQQEFATRSQLFTATTRQLHGFKGNFNLGNLQITALFSNDLQGFQRDTIPADGTSGFYFLSRRLVLPGSETVAIEVEELNRPGTVVRREQLVRGPDYEIDYDRGTLLFRKPLLRTDLSDTGEVLVRRIVVTYQFEEQSSGNTLYAGRLRYHLDRTQNQETWLGATYLRENLGVRSFELYGADALITFGPRQQVVAEFARSNNESEAVGLITGSAYRIEATANFGNWLDTRAYLRSASTGFANNATISFVPGQLRYGAEASTRISENTRLRVQYDFERNDGIAPRPLATFEDVINPGVDPTPGSRVDNSLTTVSLGVQQKLGQSELTMDWLYRSREDRINPNTLSGDANQLRTRFRMPLGERLSFIAQNELSLSSNPDPVFPDRTVLGVNWEALPGINFRLAQQFFHNGQFAGRSITTLDMGGEYRLSEDTSLIGRYSVLGGADTVTSQGAIGLRHGLTLLPGLRLDLSYERIFGGSLLGTTAAGSQFLQPFAVGQSASVLGVSGGNNYSIGLTYTDNPNFQASARFERRTSSQGNNTVINAAALGKLSPALTALFRFQQASSASSVFSGLGSTMNLRLGLAYRDPANDNFNALLRYEYRQNPSTIPDTLLLGSGTGSNDHTFALEAVYAPSWQWEFYGKYALRSSTSYLANDFVGSSTVSLVQSRVVYRMGYNMDLVGEARWISQGSAGYSETGFVLETGYYLTPDLRLAVGYSTGRVNADRDFSGSRSAGGLYATFTLKLNGLINDFGLQPIGTPQQRESLVNRPQSPDAAPETSSGSGLNFALGPLDLDFTETNLANPTGTSWVDRANFRLEPSLATIPALLSEEPAPDVVPEVTTLSDFRDRPRAAGLLALESPLSLGLEQIEISPQFSFVPASFTLKRMDSPPLPIMFQPLRPIAGSAAPVTLKLPQSGLAGGEF